MLERNSVISFILLKGEIREEMILLHFETLIEFKIRHQLNTHRN